MKVVYVVFDRFNTVSKDKEKKTFSYSNYIYSKTELLS